MKGCISVVCAILFVLSLAFSAVASKPNPYEYEVCTTYNVCDFNRDGQVDVVDIMEVFMHRGEEVTEDTLHLDIDGDGVISINDARLCVLQCTNESCAQ